MRTLNYFKMVVNEWAKKLVTVYSNSDRLSPVLPLSYDPTRVLTQVGPKVTWREETVKSAPLTLRQDIELLLDYCKVSGRFTLPQNKIQILGDFIIWQFVKSNFVYYMSISNMGYDASIKVVHGPDGSTKHIIQICGVECFTMPKRDFYVVALTDTLLLFSGPTKIETEALMEQVKKAIRSNENFNPTDLPILTKPAPISELCYKVVTSQPNPRYDDPQFAITHKDIIREVKRDLEDEAIAKGNYRAIRRRAALDREEAIYAEEEATLARGCPVDFIKPKSDTNTVREIMVESSNPNVPDMPLSVYNPTFTPIPRGTKTEDIVTISEPIKETIPNNTAIVTEGIVGSSNNPESSKGASVVDENKDGLAIISTDGKIVTYVERGKSIIFDQEGKPTKEVEQRRGQGYLVYIEVRHIFEKLVNHTTYWAFVDDFVGIGEGRDKVVLDLNIQLLHSRGINSIIDVFERSRILSTNPALNDPKEEISYELYNCGEDWDVALNNKKHPFPIEYCNRQRMGRRPINNASISKTWGQRVSAFDEAILQEIRSMWDGGHRSYFMSLKGKKSDLTKAPYFKVEGDKIYVGDYEYPIPVPENIRAYTISDYSEPIFLAFSGPDTKTIKKYMEGIIIWVNSDISSKIGTWRLTQIKPLRQLISSVTRNHPANITRKGKD